MNQKKCLKCGHIATFDGTQAPLACPKCSAIYSKVEEAMRQREGDPSAPPSRLPAQRRPASLDHYEFADDMRGTSLYPAFRAVVGVIYWVGIVFAALCLLSGIVITAKSNIGPGPAIGGVVMAVIVYIIFRVTKEASLMLADIADATVRMAASGEKTGN